MAAECVRLLPQDLGLPLACFDQQEAEQVAPCEFDLCALFSSSSKERRAEGAGPRPPPATHQEGEAIWDQPVPCMAGTGQPKPVSTEKGEFTAALRPACLLHSSTQLPYSPPLSLSFLFVKRG
jgi:hypothetical protein